jgi:hypothetical protein
MAAELELTSCRSRNSNLRSAESQQRRTQAARDGSVGEIVFPEEPEHVLLSEAKSFGESTARPCRPRLVGTFAGDSFNISHWMRAESERSSETDANSAKPTRTATSIPTTFPFMVFRIERVKVTTECVRCPQESTFFCGNLVCEHSEPLGYERSGNVTAVNRGSCWRSPTV